MMLPNRSQMAFEKVHDSIFLRAVASWVCLFEFMFFVRLFSCLGALWVLTWPLSCLRVVTLVVEVTRKGKYINMNIEIQDINMNIENLYIHVKIEIQNMSIPIYQFETIYCVCVSS